MNNARVVFAGYLFCDIGVGYDIDGRLRFFDAGRWFDAYGKDDRVSVGNSPVNPSGMIR